MIIINSQLVEWNEHPITMKLKKELRGQLEALASAVMEGDCVNNNAAYISCVSEYKVMKSIIEDSLIKSEILENDSYGSQQL